MDSKRKTLVLGICMILLSTGFIVSLSQPFSDTLIVVFGNSEAEKSAIRTLQEELPASQVVEYDSLEYNLLKTRCIGIVIMVGHGDMNGIYQENRLVGAEEIFNEISLIPAQKIMLAACNSGNIAVLDKSGRTFGFDHAVDAELAALEIVLRIQAYQNLISLALSTFDKILNVLSVKINDEDSIQPLRIVYDDGGGGTTYTHSLSTSELYNAAYICLLGLIFALVGVGISAATSKLAGIISSRVGSMSATSGLLGNLFNFFSAIGPAGLGSLTALVNSIFGGFLNFANAWLTTSVDVVNTWITAMDIYEWAFFLTLTALEVILIICTCGAEAAIRLAAGAGIAVTNAAIIAISDYNDYNDIPCQSVMEAASQLIG